MNISIVVTGENRQNPAGAADVLAKAVGLAYLDMSQNEKERDVTITCDGFTATVSIRPTPIAARPE